jgi:hypothetical protein
MAIATAPGIQTEHCVAPQGDDPGFQEDAILRSGVLHTRGERIKGL